MVKRKHKLVPRFKTTPLFPEKVIEYFKFTVETANQFSAEKKSPCTTYNFNGLKKLNLHSVICKNPKKWSKAPKRKQY